jgi:hypothetical protein
MVRGEHSMIPNLVHPRWRYQGRKLLASIAIAERSTNSSGVKCTAFVPSLQGAFSR